MSAVWARRRSSSSELVVVRRTRIDGGIEDNWIRRPAEHPFTQGNV
ncbi:MAG TPA: hypothetical protein VI259_26410 [Gemmatimonadaceae bacterium]